MRRGGAGEKGTQNDEKRKKEETREKYKLKKVEEWRKKRIYKIFF